MSKKKNKNNKFCKREGENLEFFSDKKIKIKKFLTPGEHGFEKNKNSDYGLILRTKQKIKRYYCIFEKQFKNIYKKIYKNFFKCKDLINFLERRLDNLIYRMNFCISRKSSRQMILHGFVFVNYKKIRIPSFLIFPGDSILIKKFLIKKYLYDFKKNYFLNWIYCEYFNGFGIFLCLPNKNKFFLDKNLLLDLYK